MSMWKALSVMGLVGVMGVGSALAYEEVTVGNGGSLSGRVTLNGDVPQPKGYNLVTFPDPIFCGRISTGSGWRLLQPFTVSPNGGFQNVVVSLINIEKGKKFEAPTPRIEAIDCKFEPYITVVRDQHKVDVVNLDPVMHDIQAYETSDLGARVLFNVPLPMSERLTKSELLKKVTVKNRAGKVMTQPVKMRKGRNIFVMQCGFHAYMESWGVAVDHPYYTLTDKEGNFTIGDIPPGTYQVSVWHPMVTQEFTVTIEAGTTSQHDIQFDAPKGRLYANALEETPRFGMELLGDAVIDPIVEKQVP